MSITILLHLQLQYTFILYQQKYNFSIVLQAESLKFWKSRSLKTSNEPQIWGSFFFVGKFAVENTKRQ